MSDGWTGKKRVHAALSGRPVDRTPVASSYSYLYYRDHFAELTGRQPAALHAWLHAEPQEYVEIFKAIIQKVPFDILQPEAWRQHVAPTWAQPPASPKAPPKTPPRTISGHAVDYSANETQYVFDRRDVAGHVRIAKAKDLIATGVNDYIEAVVEALGRDHFIMSGGVVGTLWSCTTYVGQTNLLAMLVEAPDLVDYLSKRILEQTIETIRRLAAAGGDAIFIDDAMSTSDMISVKHYERFSLPYVTEMVREIQRLGHKAVVIYFGGVADRLEQIASTGADGFAPETSMKGYVNDIARIAEKIGDRISIFGNVDPVGILQNASDAEVEREVRRQALAGKKARGFVMSTGSPITPGTPLAHVRRFIELGRRRWE